MRRRRMRLPGFVVAMGLGVLTSPGCGGGKTDPVPRASATPAGTPAAHAPSPTPPSVATEPAEAPPTLIVEPATATLLSGDPGVQLVASITDDRRSLTDRTGAATWTASPPGVVSIEPGGYARAVGPGQATVTATLDDGSTASAEVVVDGSAERPWDFAADIVPIFTRFGCNGGACHGKTNGQKGFHLALFGYDPEEDLLALTRDAGGRRINPMDPDASLLLRKATGRTSHGGGPVLTVDSDAYRTLRDWIATARSSPSRSSRPRSGSTSPARSSSGSSPDSRTGTSET
jgi:hypothetical protein